MGVNIVCPCHALRVFWLHLCLSYIKCCIREHCPRAHVTSKVHGTHNKLKYGGGMGMRLSVGSISYPLNVNANPTLLLLVGRV